MTTETNTNTTYLCYLCALDPYGMHDKAEWEILCGYPLRTVYACSRHLDEICASAQASVTPREIRRGVIEAPRARSLQP